MLTTITTTVILLAQSVEAPAWAVLLIVAAAVVGLGKDLVLLLVRGRDSALTSSFANIDRSLAGINASVTKLETRFESYIEQAQHREIVVERRLARIEAQTCTGDSGGDD